MDRRTFNKITGLAAIGAFSRNVELGAEQTTAQKDVVLDPIRHSGISHQVVLEDETILVALLRRPVRRADPDGTEISSLGDPAAS